MKTVADFDDGCKMNPQWTYLRYTPWYAAEAR